MHKLGADSDGSGLRNSIGCGIRPTTVMGHLRDNRQARKVVLASRDVASVIVGHSAQVLDSEEEDVTAGAHLVTIGVDCLH